jgi:hypothetical protein
VHFVKIWNKAKTRLAEQGIEEPAPPNPNVALPILAAAADETNDELQDLWARLLAAAMNPNRLKQVFDRKSRDGQNVVPGLGRQIAVAGEPVRNTGRTGIVGGGGQSKIAKTLLEGGEKVGPQARTAVTMAQKKPTSGGSDEL